LTAYEILMIVITVALLIVEIIKLCKSDASSRLTPTRCDWPL